MACFEGNIASALVSIAVRYSLTSSRPAPTLEPASNLRGHFDFTLEVIDAITIEAILNCSVRLTMP